MSEFAAHVDRFFDELFRIDPLSATAAGRHDHDARWPDVSDAGRAAWLAWLTRWRATLEAIDPATLTTDDAIDRERLLGRLAAWTFTATELREERWDPLGWVYLMGGGLFPLIAREFAPLAERLASLAGRLEGLPAIVEAARDQLKGTVGRPVARLHAAKAAADVDGVAGLVMEGLAIAEAAADSDPAVAATLPRLRSAAAAAEASLAAFKAHLVEAVLPASAGDGRLGPELFARKLRHVLSGVDPTPEQLAAEAERSFVAVRGEMIRLARGAWSTWRPGEDPPADDGAAVRGVLDAVARDHPPADGMLEECRVQLRRIEAFCRERGVIGLADEPLAIDWTPVFLRSFGGAMLDAPGPFDHGQRTFFFVTPCDPSWPASRTESYLREQNRRQLAILTIHEAVPGHYLQAVYGHRTTSLVRAVLGDGVFAEGWAVYATQVMIDHGFGEDDPAQLLAHWKYFLRCAANAIIDVGIHVRQMTEDEAMSLMVEGAFQEEAEARAKWDRARLTSAQLSTYFVGSMAFWELERAVRSRRAAEAGAAEPAAAIPPPRVVGALGETPGFNYRQHLERVISHGELPLPQLRRVVLGD